MEGGPSPFSLLRKCGWCQDSCSVMKPLSLVTFGAIGRTGRRILDFSTHREEQVRVGAGLGGGSGVKGAGLGERGLACLERQAEGRRLGRSFGFREMADPTERRLSVSSGPEPRGLVFPCVLAKEVALVRGALARCRPQLWDPPPGH